MIVTTLESTLVTLLLLWRHVCCCVRSHYTNSITQFWEPPYIIGCRPVVVMLEELAEKDGSTMRRLSVKQKTSDKMVFTDPLFRAIFES